MSARQEETQPTTWDNNRDDKSWWGLSKVFEEEDGPALARKGLPCYTQGLWDMELLQHQLLMAANLH